jgi:hypothetical protein
MLTVHGLFITGLAYLIWRINGGQPLTYLNVEALDEMDRFDRLNAINQHFQWEEAQNQIRWLCLFYACGWLFGTLVL